MTPRRETQRRFVVAIDVGNSAVKVAVRSISNVDCEPTDLKSSDSVEQAFLLKDVEWMIALCDWVHSNTVDGSPNFWVSTVNQAVSEPLQQEIGNRFPSASWNQVRYEGVPLNIDVDFPDRVGIDRLVGGFAASKMFDDPVVVVDAGSAVTVDWIDQQVGEDTEFDHVFSGGAILPGIDLQLAALANGTEAIQKIPFDSSQAAEPVEPRFVPAKNTADAIRLGVTAGLVGSVQRLAADYAGEKQGSAVKIVITGGDARLVSSYLTLPHTVVPNLVCDGLIHLGIAAQ